MSSTANVSIGRHGSQSEPACCFGCNNNFTRNNSTELIIEKPKGCTDIIFLLLYFIFGLLMVVIAVFAVNFGNPLRLVNGMDSFGNICGMKNEPIENMNFTGMDMTERPFVLYFDLASMSSSKKICVQSCPETKLSVYKDLRNLYMKTKLSICLYDYDMSQTAQNPMYHLLCPQLPYPPSVPVLKRCIPKTNGDADNDSSTIMSQVYSYLNSLSPFQQILGDLAVTWPLVLGLTALSFLISLVLVLFIYLITAVFSYFVLGLSATLSVGFTTFLWYTYCTLKNELALQPATEYLNESVRNKTAFFFYSILSTVFTIFLILLVVYLMKRVKLIVKLFQEAGNALRSMPCIFFQPFVTFGVLALYFLGWLLIVLCLATSDYPSSRRFPLIKTTPGLEDEIHNHNLSSVPSARFSDSTVELTAENRSVNVNDLSDVILEYNEASWVKYTWIIYILGLIWVSEFILACQQMVVATCVSTWYFSRHRNYLNFLVLQSVTRLVKHHLGSMAFGALVITLVKIPRLILQFVQALLVKLEPHLGLAGWILAKCSYLNYFEHVHHNAYTVIAVQGVNFCPAGKLANQALLQNELQLIEMNRTGDFLLFLTKCITACTTGLISVLIFQSNENLYFYAIPVLLTIVFSYFVAHCVVSAFEMAVDTLFLCFCEDYNMNSESRHYYASKSLFDYMTMQANNRLSRDYSNGNGSKDVRTPCSGDTIIGEELMPMKSRDYS